MAHFAQIDENNIVTRVVVIANEDTSDENGNEVESIGVDFCKSLFGADTNWVQTSYNGNIRYNYAGIGFTWDAENNAFYTPQPFASWSLDAAFKWQAPIPYPQNGEDYYWDEDSYNSGSGGWVLIPFEGE